MTVVLVLFEENVLEKSQARLFAEGVRDVRPVRDEVELSTLCQRQTVGI